MLNEEPLPVVEVEVVWKEIHRWMRKPRRGTSGVGGQAELYEVGEEAPCAQAKDSIWIRLW